MNRVFHKLSFYMSHDPIFFLQYFGGLPSRVGLHRILIWPDIRPFFLPDIRSGRISVQISTKRKSCLLLVRFWRLFRNVFYRILNAFITLINPAFLYIIDFQGNENCRTNKVNSLSSIHFYRPKNLLYRKTKKEWKRF